MNHLNCDTPLAQLSRRGGDCSPKSIFKAMDNFLSAMNHMRETVMVPSRLKGVEATVPILDGPCTVGRTPSPSSSSLVPFVMSSLGRVRKPEPPPAETTVDLFSFYSLLDTVQQELVCGSDAMQDHCIDSTDDDSSLDGSLDSYAGEDESRRLASAFRQHIQGLFSVLHQMTQTANVLSKCYQDEVNAGGNGPSSL